MYRVSLEEWLPLYEEIRRLLNIDPEGDRTATRLLNSMLKGRGLTPSSLEGLLKGKPVIVFGAGPSLEASLSELTYLKLHLKCRLIAADGATTALVERGLRPDVVCSDLDGRVEDQVKVNSEGALLVVHAHGDNIPLLESYIPRLKGPVMGSTQVEPLDHVYNLGGFTDGDRCVFLAEWAGADLIALVGMDLGEEVSRYSKPSLKATSKAWQAKKIKLGIAKRLLEWLAPRCGAELYVVGGARLRGFKAISLSELADIV